MSNVDKVMSALSKRVRRDVMRLLADGGEHRLFELMDKLDIPQSNMSRHLKKLKLAGLVQDERDGQSVRFRISSALGKKEVTFLKAVLALSENHSGGKE
ncbi:winged helix-turn-helix transcriptional regulator [Cohaesibacter sp. CAU 1516]|nr:winged helix-turn-helix transcriptional regulator [Cohaesibacter sp. CAU 1516]